MIFKNSSKTLCLLTVIALASMPVSPCQAAIIFQDDFNGSGATNLHTQSPDIGGENWFAHTSYKANGTTSTRSSATLAFTPVDDVIYILDTRIINTGGDWIGVGFANGQSTASGNNARFVSNSTPEARGWTLFRNNAGTRNTFIGKATDSGEAWDGLTGNLGNTIDIRMVLTDNVAGAGVDWFVTYYAKLPASGSYTQIRAASGDVDNDITSVGFANNGSAGTLEFFQLSSVPEPTSTALLSLGGLTLILRRRR